MSSKKRLKRRKSRMSKASTGRPQKKAAPDGNAANSARSQPAPVDGVVEIRRLISKDKYKAAVTKAKEYHKHLGTQESETILVDAYVGRIREMIDKGLAVDARALIGLVRDRYSSGGKRLDEMDAVISVRNGLMDDFVRPLNDPGISQEKCMAIEDIIKRELVDLNALARCEALSPDHPLKKGAFAVAEAFAAVTSGPVEDEDEEIALSGVPRRSPMAPWKMIVRAIACFYRHDDEACEKCLQAIDGESAPARFVPVIRAMIGAESNKGFKGNAKSLIAKVDGNVKVIHNSLKTLDKMLDRENPIKTPKVIRDTVCTCEQACPELLEKLKQHISIRAWMNGFEAKSIIRAMKGPSLKNAYFWRLQARASEVSDQPLWACRLWEEFRRHAIHEGWFSGDGPEVAILYIHMAEMLGRLPEDELESRLENFEHSFSGLGFYYEKQPQSILDVVSEDAGEDINTCFLNPERLYRLASEIDPRPETFQQWLDWIEKNDSGWKETDAVALAWHGALSNDTRPLLYLMKSAEKRNALKKALGYLEKAERLNGLSPDVRRARLRLLVATAIRHLKQTKTHLAKKDFKEIDILPQSREGDRPAFLAALRCICAVIDKEKSELSRWRGELIRVLESSHTATVVMKGLISACRLPQDIAIRLSVATDSLGGNDLATGVARACTLGDDMGVSFNIPAKWEESLSLFFAEQECPLDTSLIRALAEAALRNKNMELAYSASGAGLLRGGTDSAKFLLLRARSLPRWMDRRDDCIAAATDIARRQRDMDLLDEAIELKRGEKGTRYGFPIWDSIMDKSDFSMDTEKSDEVIHREKEAQGYPSSVDYLPDYDDYYDDDDDDDDDDEWFDDLPFDLPPDIPPEIFPLFMELLLEHGGINGELPDPQELAEKDPDLMDKVRKIILKHAEANGKLPDLDGGRFPGTKGRSKKSRRKGRRK